MSRWKMWLAAATAVGSAAAVAAAFAASGGASSDGTAQPAEPSVISVPSTAPGPAALPEAPATIQRTFVSTGGDDANPCTSTAPCRSFATAIANTTAGGEVVALTSGGYGSFTVPKAITVAGAPGAHVAVTGSVTVNTGSADVVVLRNLYLTGLGAAVGIWVQTDGVLHVDSVTVTGFGQIGLYAFLGTRLLVRNSSFRGNGDAGMFITGSTRADVTDSHAEGNGSETGPGIGFLVQSGALASFVRCTATDNDAEGFFFAGGSGTLAGSVASGNADGVSVTGAVTPVVTITGTTLTSNEVAGLRAGENGVVRIGGSTVTRNGTGLLQDLGTLESFGDNLVRGNTTETSGTITAVGKT